VRGFAAAQARYEAQMPPEGPDQIECEDCGGSGIEGGGLRWIVCWDNGHACGDLPGSYATEAEAEAAGRDWQAAMLAATPGATEADYEYEAQDAGDCSRCDGTGMVDPPEPDGEPDDYDDRDDYDDTRDDYEGP
jgi:hypothetical protein